MRTEVMRNIFGEEIKVQVSEGKRKPTVRNGYANVPGTGPQGETCQSCRHATRVGNTKKFYKCALLRKHWTHGQGTDILLKSPACRKWESTAPSSADSEAKK